MQGGGFETVAIAYSQPQAGVILSLFGWHGIPAYARNIEHIRAACPITLALGGIPICVHPDYAEEARALLIEAEAIPGGVEAEPLFARVAKVVILGVLGATPPPRISAEIVAR